MARVKIDLPSRMPFSTELPVRITDINYGGHLGNDALLALIHEARVRFFALHGFTEHNIGGAGIIMTDAALAYRAEVFYGETLRVEVGVADIQSAGCDLYYRLTMISSGREAARAKTGLAFFDYSARRITAMPDAVRTLFLSLAETSPE